jgi:hypothetical protein
MGMVERIGEMLGLEAEAGVLLVDRAFFSAARAFQEAGAVSASAGWAKICRRVCMVLKMPRRQQIPEDMGLKNAPLDW